MNKHDSKIQTCVLRVSIHCDGCKHKVKKKLQKVEGVYKVNIDGELGKVTVSGNVDPATLIKKLEKAGKHGELWGGKTGPISFNNFQIEKTNCGKQSKTRKGVKEQQHKLGFQAPQQMHLSKGSKDVRVVSKDQRSVRFDLPEDDDFEEDDSEFDGPELNKATPKGHLKDKNGGNGKKSGGINMFIKGILGKAGGSSDRNVGNSHNREVNRNVAGKRNGNNGSFVSTSGGKTNYSWSKKVGKNFDGVSKQEGLNDREIRGVRNVGAIGEKGYVKGVQAAAMNVGHFQGNLYNYNQQQYIESLMNQESRNRRQDVSYGPVPMVADQYAHIFSDENTDSCSIM